MEKHGREENFQRFMSAWEQHNQHIFEQLKNKDSFLHKMRQSITQYHLVCSEAEAGN
jgi:hypothetical protein